jgi:hypothetical protein
LEDNKMAKFKEGDKVVLKANLEEGWSEQSGIVSVVEDQIKYPGMYLVAVDPEDDPEDEFDDGIREVHENHIK